MDPSEDWCFFQKIKSKDIGITSPDMHSAQLISVNNNLG